MEDIKSSKSKPPDKHINIKIIIKICCFQEMLIHKINLPYNKNEEDINIGNEIMLINKNIMKIYKDFYQYKKISDEIKKKNYLLLDSIKDKNNIINYNKLNDSILLNIINSLPKNLVDIALKSNKNELLSKLKENNKKEENDIKYIKFENPKIIRLTLLDFFEIINIDIFNLLNEQIQLNNFMFGNCIFGDKYLFISVKQMDNTYYEIGNLNKNGDFEIQYIFNKNEITSSASFIEFLREKGIKNLLNEFNPNEDIHYFIHDKKSISCYKIEKKNIKEITPLSNKIKVIILLSIYQQKINQKQKLPKNVINVNLEDVFLINKKFLEYFYYNEISDLFNNYYNFVYDINKININNLSIKSINGIINELDVMVFLNIDKAISEVKNSPKYKAKEETIKLLNNKNINIYKEYNIINKKIFHLHLLTIKKY